jgi:membrane-associated phospholipid phosphatase
LTEREGWLGLDLGHDGPEPLPVLRRRLLVAGLVLLVLGTALTAAIATAGGRAGVQRVDEEFRELMVSLRWQPLVTVSDALSVAFSTVVLWPVRVAVTVAIALRRRWLALSSWMSTVILSELAIGPVKALLDRPRPPGSMIGTSGASYPSGHAIASAVTAIGVVMALTSGRRRLHWMVTAVCIATAVALSRTYLSAHWLSDVIGGSLLGAGFALAVPEAFEVVRDRRRAAAVSAAAGSRPAA